MIEIFLFNLFKRFQITFYVSYRLFILEYSYNNRNVKQTPKNMQFVNNVMSILSNIDTGALKSIAWHGHSIQSKTENFKRQHTQMCVSLSLFAKVKI